MKWMELLATLLYLIFLDSGIMNYPNVVVDIKMEQWPALTPGFRDYEVIKRIILGPSEDKNKGRITIHIFLVNISKKLHLGTFLMMS